MIASRSLFRFVERREWTFGVVRCKNIRTGEYVVVLTEPGYFEHVIVLFPDGTLLATNMMNFAKKKGLFERVE